MNRNRIFSVVILRHNNILKSTLKYRTHYIQIIQSGDKELIMFLYNRASTSDSWFFIAITSLSYFTNNE